MATRSDQNKVCIICRESKHEFNDEHVIPDAIGGYYHIYSVCKDCNSKIGGKVDSKLVNHKFMEFQRYILGLKGKKGTVPNPLKGTHTMRDSPNQKVILDVDAQGKFVPQIVQKVEKHMVGEVLNAITVHIPKKDESKKEEIVEKVLRRNGIDPSTVAYKESYHEDHSYIATTLVIDTKNFKLAMLKIAYEFVVDTIPGYFNDPCAVVISEILHQADFKRMETDVTFIGSGFEHKILTPFEHLINVSDNNHYLILLPTENLGLICLINLFNTFSIGIQMSTNNIHLSDAFYIGKNDIVNHSYNCYTAEEILNKTFSHPEYRFMYEFPNIESQEFFLSQEEKHPAFGYYSIDGNIPFFRLNGSIAYKDIDEKLLLLERAPKGDVINSFIDEFMISDEDLYIRTLPLMNLYKVVGVRAERYRIGYL